MRTLRRLSVCLLPASLVVPVLALGCSGVNGVRTGQSTQIKTIASVGDRPLPVVSGTPGESVAAGQDRPERRTDPEGRISGRVVDVSGNPVPNARVRLAVGGASGGQVVRTTTDGSGGFTLHGLRPGASYTVIAEADDAQGVITGRRPVRAPDARVQIRLRDLEDRPQGQAQEPEAPARSRKKVSPISSREETDDEAEPDDDDALTDRPRRRRVNEEDLPPAPEAESLAENDTAESETEAVEEPPAERPRRRMPQLAAPVQSTGWRKGGSDDPAPADDTPAGRASASFSDSGGAEEPAATASRSPSAATPSSEPDDDGPNPLPPAIESGPKPTREPETQAASPPVAPASTPVPPSSRPEPEPAAAPAPAPAPTPDPAPTPAPSEAPGAVTPSTPQEPSQPTPEPTPTPTPAPAEPASSPPSSDEASTASAPTPAPAPTPASAEPPAAVAPETSGQAEPTQEAARPAESPAPMPAPAPADAPMPAPSPAEAGGSSPASPGQGGAEAPAASNGGAPAQTSSAFPPDRASQAYNPFVLAAHEAAAPAANEGQGTSWGDLAAKHAAMTPRLAVGQTSGSGSKPATAPSGSVVPAALTADPAPPPPARVDLARLVSRRDSGRKASCTYDNRHRRLVDFRLPDLKGQLVRFQDLDADYILLDFWGTWCGYCVESIPHLVELQKQLGPKRVKVVGIAYEEGPTAERVQAVSEMAQRFGINYTLLLGGIDGPCPLQSAMHVQAYPTMILVDRYGRILWRDQGATPATLARLDRVLASATRGDFVRR